MTTIKKLRLDLSVDESLNIFLKDYAANIKFSVPRLVLFLLEDLQRNPRQLGFLSPQQKPVKQVEDKHGRVHRTEIAFPYVPMPPHWNPAISNSSGFSLPPNCLLNVQLEQNKKKALLLESPEATDFRAPIYAVTDKRTRYITSETQLTPAQFVRGLWVYLAFAIVLEDTDGRQMFEGIDCSERARNQLMPETVALSDPNLAAFLEAVIELIRLSLLTTYLEQNP